MAGRIHFSQHLSTQVGLEYYYSYKLKWQEMDRVCLSPSKEGCFPGDLLAEPQVEAGATFLEAELPGGWWQVCRVLGNVWDGALVSGHSSSGIRILTPSSKVPVEGQSLQWVSAHDLLVLMVPPGEATTWDPSPFRTTYKRGNQYLPSDPNKAEISQGDI